VGVKKTHGMSEVPGYGSWHQMRQRCTRKSHPSYKHYGGKGIRYCKRWDSFANFINDLGPKPDGMTLERIDSKKNYSPKNCRWASRHDQARNKSNNVWITYAGRRMILADWAKELGVPLLRLHKRLFRDGYTIAEAFQMPHGEGRCKMISFGGKRLSITAWSKRLGLTVPCVAKRIKDGWPLAVALNARNQRGRRVVNGGAINALV
jgi:hypothetical protein